MDDTDLPRALIKRIAKASLTQVQTNEGKTDVKDIQLSKDAILALSESARVFINYLTATGRDCLGACVTSKMIQKCRLSSASVLVRNSRAYIQLGMPILTLNFPCTSDNVHEERQSRFLYIKIQNNEEHRIPYRTIYWPITPTNL